MPTSRPLALLAALAIAAGPAAADPGPRPLRWDPARDVAVAAGAWAALGASELARDRLAPSSCRFCGTNALDAEARELLRWDSPERARNGSNVALALVYAGATAHQLLAARAAGDARAGLVDVLVVVEAAGLAMDLDQVTKLAVGRQRPFVRYVASREPGRAPDPDDNLSFYSGHSTLAFSIAAAAGSVSSMRGYRSAPWVWAAGMTFAAATAYLRVAADRHYLTDVLVGAAAGTAVGVAVPRLLHAPEESRRVAVTALPLGVRVSF